MCVCVYVEAVGLMRAACHVFDCTYMSDDVLTTMGQCFVLAKVSVEAER
jgi:hypothetical protein